MSSNSHHFHDGTASTISAGVTHVSIHPSVTALPQDAFDLCRATLQHVIVPNSGAIGSLGCIEDGTFHDCKVLTAVDIPPSVETIGSNAFLNCICLTSVIFSNTSSSSSMLREIGSHAFYWCVSLSELHLPDTVTHIGGAAFCNCPLPNLRVPTAITTMDIRIIEGMKSLVSMEIPEHVQHVFFTFSPARLLGNTLRNVAFPPGCDVEVPVLWMFDSLINTPFVMDHGNIMDDGEFYSEMSKALRHRFTDLPIHRLCYYQSFHDVESVMRDLRRTINPWATTHGGSIFLGRLDESGTRQDCLGMTPLHILTCSTRHSLFMYQLLVCKYTENLVTLDAWGDVPLLYAFWCNGSDEIIQYLVQSYKTWYPEFVFDWGGMVQTLAEKGRVPTSRIQLLLTVQRCDFPDQVCDLRDVVRRLANHTQQRTSRNPFTTSFQHPPYRASIQTFRFLLRDIVNQWVADSGIGRWRIELLSVVDEIPGNDKDDWRARIRGLFSLLDRCELWKVSMGILELALWKARITVSDGERRRGHKKPKVDDGVGIATMVSHRSLCRIHCGADIVVRNVLPYLSLD